MNGSIEILVQGFTYLVTGTRGVVHFVMNGSIEILVQGFTYLVTDT